MSEKPTNEELADRLDELSDFIIKTPNLPSEFSMRVPADNKRDADLVLAIAAERLRHYPAEVQAVLDAAEKLLDETTGVAIDLPIQVENGLEELYSTLKALKEK